MQHGQRLLRLRSARIVRVRLDPEHRAALSQHDAGGHRQAPAIVAIERRQVDATAGVPRSDRRAAASAMPQASATLLPASNSKSKASFICARISSEIVDSCGEITTSSAPRA